MPKNERRYTYADYRNWPEDERWELIEGEAFAMGAPSWTHQELVAILTVELRLFLKGKPCRPFVSPVDVFLPAPGQTVADIDAVDTVVQPDLGVVCDRSRIIPRGVFGAPDLVMEILSPSSVLHDLNRKKDLYARAGVREYWVWSQALDWVTIQHLTAEGIWDEGESFGPEQSARSQVLAGFGISLADIRAELIRPE